jgi:hypothetical protein
MNTLNNAARAALAGNCPSTRNCVGRVVVVVCAVAP